MKKYFLLCCTALFFTVACNNSTQKNNQEEQVDGTEVIDASTVGGAVENLGKIEFVETVYDFGTVKEGQLVEHVFEFANKGDGPVILSQVSASCGCTTPDYTKTPVLPGAVGEIKVTFDSKGQVGNQQKIVTVSSNASNNVTTVQIKGTVEK